MPSDTVGVAAEAWLRPDWPRPAGIHAVVSTRFGPGGSQAPYARFNLGMACGDDLAQVAANRAALQAQLGLPSAPHWLQQVHGTHVWPVTAAAATGAPPQADAAVTMEAGQVLAILTADCLPVLLTSADGAVVAAAHAGWRGLAAGVLEATVAAMPRPARSLSAWLGPCIGAQAYEVGDEVRAAFIAVKAEASAAFSATTAGHWRCDLALLARQRLQALGVQAIYGGDFDTMSDPRFYSYRGEAGRTGRFVSLIWRD